MDGRGGPGDGQTSPERDGYTSCRRGQSTPLAVGDDGSFTADAFSKTAATLRISLSGYYDMVLARPGDQMTGTWNIGEIKAEVFTKIPGFARD